MHFISLQLFLKHGAHEMSSLIIVWPSPYGPVLNGSVGPKIAKTGMPRAAAICMGPESLLTIKRAPLIISMRPFRSVLPTSDTDLLPQEDKISFAILLSPFPPTITVLMGRSDASSPNFSGGHLFVFHLAPGTMTA